MPERVVHGLEVVEIDVVDADHVALVAGSERGAGEGLEGRAVRQARETVAEGEVEDLRTRKIVPDRDREHVDAGLDDATFEIVGSAAFAPVEGEGGDHVAALILDRARPAGPETDGEGEPLVLRPERIVFDVGDQHLLPPVGGGPTGAGHRTDGDAIDRVGVVRRQARRGEGAQTSGIVDGQDGGSHAAGEGFGLAAERVGDVPDGTTERDGLQNVALQFQKRLDASVRHGKSHSSKDLTLADTP